MGISDLRFQEKPFVEFNRTLKGYLLSPYVDHLLKVRGVGYVKFHKTFKSSPTWSYDATKKVITVTVVRRGEIKEPKKVVDIVFTLFYRFEDGALGSFVDIPTCGTYPLAYKRAEETDIKSLLRILGYRLSDVANLFSVRKVNVRRERNLTTVFGKRAKTSFELTFRPSGTIRVDDSHVNNVTGSELNEMMKKGLI